MMSMQSQHSSYRSSSSLSPTSIAGVVAVHVALGAAIMSMTTIDSVRERITVLWARNIRATPPPPQTDPAPSQPEPTKHETHLTTAKPVIILSPQPDDAYVKPADQTPLGGIGGGSGTLPDIKPFDPPPAPVMVEARPDARYAGVFQPAYPAAMLRMQVEGAVTVRVMIGADGRVTDVTLIDAIDPAFFEATKRQALSRWRFIPATRDGVPIPSERVMTVHFRLTD